MELTKVYVVQADNCEDYECYSHWTDGVFASEESAKKYIANEEKRYDEDMRRIYELEELNDRRRDDGTYDSFEIEGWTMEEYSEHRDLSDYWLKACRCCPHYWIVEFELKS